MAPTPRILFAGTPAFARVSLAALVAAGIRPVAVYTQPDRPAGRGRALTMSPVKQFALAAALDVRQPHTLKDAAAETACRELAPDLLIVAAYGLLLPPAVLDIPRLGCLNVHASVLPRWRGAAPIQAAILAGDATSGISLMAMEAGLDTGPVYATAEIPIGARETSGELHDRLARLGAELLLDRLDDLLHGRLKALAQDSGRATYAGKIRRDDARLDWGRPAAELERRIRAYDPVPGAWFDAFGERIKCWRASVLECARPAAPGSVLAADRDGVSIACGTGALRLESLQRPGKGRISGGEWSAQQRLSDVRFDDAAV